MEEKQKNNSDTLNYLGLSCFQIVKVTTYIVYKSI